MHDVRGKSIYTPSTLRMLRLVNAKLCECGGECCSFNLLAQKAGSLTSVAARPFGLALCWPCLQSLSVSTGNGRLWYKESSRILVHDHVRVLCIPQVDQATREATGSLLLFKDIKQIENTYHEKGKRMEIVEERLAELDNNISAEDQDRAKAFVTAFDSAIGRFDAHWQAKRDVFNVARLAKDAKRATRKLNISTPVYKKIGILLDGFKHKDVALACEWSESTGLCTFDNWPSRVALGRLLSAPSSVTHKKIISGVSCARDIYNLLESEGFLGVEYPCKLIRMLLQHDLQEHERALIKYFVSKKSPQVVLNTWRHERVLDALIHGEPAKIIYSLFEQRSECRDVFVSGVVKGCSKSETYSKRHKLAIEAWNRTNPNDYIRLSYSLILSFDGFEENYKECKDEYFSLRRFIRQYQTHSDTESWLAETTEPVYADQTFTRQVSPSFLDVKVLNLSRILTLLAPCCF